jgi:PPOX class probable F420-dependent enzyme
MPGSAFAQLGDHPYVNLTTYRKNGTAVKVPVWWAPAGGHAYIWTDGHSYKVKRLRHRPECAIAPCDVTGRTELGPTVRARGVVLEERDAAEAIRAMRRKYGWKFRIAYFLARFKPRRYTVFLDLVPVTD